MKHSALLGGLAGAAALTLLHESIRSIEPKKAPRMDLMGMSALSKIIRGGGGTPPPSRQLYLYTMAGDLVSNALYYSLAGIGNKKSTLEKGLGLGIAAGLGALLLPKPLHLNEQYSNRTVQTQILTVTYYVVGSLLAAAIMKRLQRR